jgi:hypothetical protein
LIGEKGDRRVMGGDVVGWGIGDKNVFRERVEVVFGTGSEILVQEKVIKTKKENTSFVEGEQVNFEAGTELRFSGRGEFKVSKTTEIEMVADTVVIDRNKKEKVIRAGEKLTLKPGEPVKIISGDIKMVKPAAVEFVSSAPSVTISAQKLDLKVTSSDKQEVAKQGAPISVEKNQPNYLNKFSSVYFVEDTRIQFFCNSSILDHENLTITIKHGDIKTFWAGNSITYQSDCKITYLTGSELRIKAAKKVSLETNAEVFSSSGDSEYKSYTVLAGETHSFESDTTLLLRKLTKIVFPEETGISFNKRVPFLNKYG